MLCKGCGTYLGRGRTKELCRPCRGLKEKERGLCRHCHQGKPCRPQGLCWRCYNTDEVRELYPSTSKYAPGKYSQEPKAPKRMPSPTQAIPGTREKIEVLAGRVGRGEFLYHPEDATMEGAIGHPHIMGHGKNGHRK